MKLKCHKINNIVEKKCKKFFKIHENFIYLLFIYMKIFAIQILYMYVLIVCYANLIPSLNKNEFGYASIYLTKKKFYIK